MTQPTAPLADLHQRLVTRDRAGINALLSDWLDHDLAVGDRWASFAEILAQHGEWTLALRAIRRHRVAAPADRARCFAEAAMLARAGCNAEAQACVVPLQGSTPRDHRIDHFLGALASEAGRFDEATRHFLAVLDADPRSGQSWLEISAIHRFTSDDPLLDRLRRVARGGLPPAVQAPLLYALGKALDDVCDVDAAFAAVARGAALVAAERRYDAAADRSEADAVIADWTGMALPRCNSAAPARRIFVTGLPRSGTTLVEQILASHPAIDGGGELNIIPIVAHQAGGATPRALGAHPHAPLVSLYDHLVAERFARGARIVDKTLDASRMLGMIATLMPDAPIIWMRRDPLDTAWSCFHTYFARGVPWSWSQAAIAAHIAQEDRLFAFWRDRLGDRLLCLDYEALVRDPGMWIPRIEDHAGLPHAPATLTPHLTARSVLTSSVAQVRMPIRTTAIGAGQRYRHHLAPFLEAYPGA